MRQSSDRKLPRMGVKAFADAPNISPLSSGLHLASVELARNFHNDGSALVSDDASRFLSMTYSRGASFP